MVEAIQTMFRYNFGTIKKLAQPGSWRRGYGYFRANQVQSVDINEQGVAGMVKGKFKEAYNIQLIFNKEGIEAKCDCPLEEEWCKHAVAVALVSIDQWLWEEFWELPIPDERVPEDIMEDPREFKGHYRFYLEETEKPREWRLKIVDRDTAKTVEKLEPVLRAAASMQNSGEKKFSEIEKNEFKIFQLLMQHDQNEASKGWFYMPVNETDALLALLAQVEDVCDKKHNQLVFEKQPLKLVMSVNVSMAGNVLISFHWVQDDPFDAFPLEEIKIAGKGIPWGQRRNHIFRLNNTLRNLPNSLIKSSFTDIRDADGGKFMYEELPRLRKLVEVDEADIIEQLKLQKKPPQKIVNVEMVDMATMRIRATLDFVYDGVKVAYSKGTPDTPYVMVIKKDKKNIYWVRRDLKAEEDAYQLLMDSGLEPVQTNNLMAEGDDAIDFYNAATSRLSEDWDVKINGDLSMMKAAEHPLKICTAIDFSKTVDLFTLEITCSVGDKSLELDEVQHHLMQGQKYFFLKGAGYVEIPIAAIFQFGKTLQAFDAEKIENVANRDLHQIQTFKAGLINELIDQGVELVLSEKFERFWNLMSTFSMDEMEVPEKVQATLRPYQSKGFNWLWFLYSYGLNGILADDMGLGKTLQTLVLLQHAKDTDGQMPSLVVCPTTIVFNWENEIRRFTPDLNIVNLTGPNRHPNYKKIKKADIVITSYAIMRRDVTALKEYKFRYVILDESQNIKNWESQTAKAAKRLQANHRLALSGTPIENRLLELWSVFDFLMPGFLYDIDEFKYKYVSQIEEKGNRDSEYRLKKQVFPFILRRMKQDVAKDLPPKIESISYCELTDEQQELYLDVLEKTREEVFANVADKGVKGSQTSIFSALLRLRQICCHPKLLGPELSKGVKESGKFEALMEMIEEIISEGHRILLFSQFVEMLKIVKKALEQRGIQYEYLTGDTPINDRQVAVERFNRDDSIPIFLISLKAGGTGLNLTGADYVIHYDPWWNPAAEDQATDRAHRIGQNKTVFVYRLIARGTVEEKIMKLQSKKRDLVDSIISADRSVGKMLSFEDLKDILTPDF